MNGNRQKSARAAALAAAISAVMYGASASAALLTQFTGWTEMNDCFLCDGTVSFAVWQRGSVPWNADPLFAGLTPTRLDAPGDADYDAPYLYLYQVVNTDHVPISNPFNPAEKDGALINFQVLNRSSQGSVFTSGGYFNGAAFTDSGGGAVFGDTNGDGNADGNGDGNYTLAASDFDADHYAGQGIWQQMGAQAPGTPSDDIAPDYFASVERNGGNVNPSALNPNQGPDDPSDHTPSRSGVTGVGLDVPALVNLVAPTGLDLFFDPTPDVLNSSNRVVNFSWLGDTFLTGQASPVLFLTSDYRPVYDFGSTQSGGGFPGAAGDIPTAAPEPTTLALLGIGIAGLGCQRRRKTA